MRRLLGAVLLICVCRIALAGDGAGLIDHYPASHSGMIDPLGATMWVSFGQDPSGATITAETGQVLTKHGTPARVRDGTYPYDPGVAGAVQGYSEDFDGAAEWWSLADGAGGDAFDPAGDFSVCAVVTPDTVAAGEDCIVSKYETAGNQKGWKFCRDTATVVLTVSADGAADTTTVLAAALVINRPSFVCATYTIATTTGVVYSDMMAPATNVAMAASTFDNTADLEIAASDTGASLWDGDLPDVHIWIGRALTAAEVAQLRDQWRGLLSVGGTPFAITSAVPTDSFVAPAASGTEPFFIPMPADTTQVGSSVAGSGGLYRSPPIDNKCWRGSLETWAAGSPTGWTETTAGGSDATQNIAHMVHGQSSAQMVCDGVNALTLDSGCAALAAASDYTASVYSITTAGAANLSLQIIEYTDVACAVGAVTTTIWTGDPGANWIIHIGTRTTGGAVQSGRIRLLLDTAAATVLADYPHLYAGTIPHESGCVTDADADAVCNAVAITHPSDLSGAGSISVEAIFRTTVGPASSFSSILITDGVFTAANTYELVIDRGWGSTNEPILRCRDNAAAVLSVAPDVLDWNANTDYRVRVAWDPQNAAGSIYWNAAWNDTNVGAGLGYRAAGQVTTYIGNVAVTTNDFWLRDLRYWRRIKR